MSEKEQWSAEVSFLRGAFQGITLSLSENGLTVDLSELRKMNVAVITEGDVVVQAPREEQTHAPGVINASVDKRAYNIGDVLPDGWIVGPISPTTGKPIAIEPVAGALEGFQSWLEGEEHAKELRSQGHASARQPDADELNVLYNGVVKAGRNHNAQFNTRDSDPLGIYWSSAPFLRGNPDWLRVQYFGCGTRKWGFTGVRNARVRCVRDEQVLRLRKTCSSFGRSY